MSIGELLFRARYKRDLGHFLQLSNMANFQNSTMQRGGCDRAKKDLDTSWCRENLFADSWGCRRIVRVWFERRLVAEEGSWSLRRPGSRRGWSPPRSPPDPPFSAAVSSTGLLGLQFWRGVTRRGYSGRIGRMERRGPPPHSRGLKCGQGFLPRVLRGSGCRLLVRDYLRVRVSSSLLAILRGSS